MAREFSAGGVVLRRMQGRWFLAAIEPQGKTNVLALPKGLVDAGERPEIAAQREVLEETGVQAALVGKLHDIKYVYVRSWGDKQRVFKIVSFYLFIYKSGMIGDITEVMKHEVARAVWLPLDEAPRKLAYKGEREVIQKALEYVVAHPELCGE